MPNASATKKQPRRDPSTHQYGWHNSIPVSTICMSYRPFWTYSRTAGSVVVPCTPIVSIRFGHFSSIDAMLAIFP